MRCAIPLALAATLIAAGAAPGFRKVFNGRELTGWHISQTSTSGNTRAWSIRSGVLRATQDPVGNGGVLLTDRKFHDFEIQLEVQPDYGCAGALLLRSAEDGQAYRLTLDYLEGGSIGRIQAEGAESPPAGWQKWWHRGDWNTLRARIEGEIPHIQVWLNDTKLTDWTDSRNRLPNGATEGRIGLQIQPNDPSSARARWIPGGFHRYRNVQVKELP